MMVPSLKMTKLAGERHSGLEIVSGRHFPPDWQNNLVTGSFNSRRVQRFAVQYDADRLSVRNWIRWSFRTTTSSGRST